ncbi:unnamed protein product, partial [Brassica rapa]
MNIVHVCNKVEVFALLLKRIDIMKESMDVRPLFSSLFRTLNCRELISEILSRRNELETHDSAR